MQVVACQMRYWKLDGHTGKRIHGSGEDEEDKEDKAYRPHADVLVLCSVHMRRMTGNSAVQRPATELQELRGDIAKMIMFFDVRVLCGDWNMSLLLLIPHLPARGIPVNIAAWYPWMSRDETLPRIDSTAIFIIGPLDGCRKRFDASVFKIRGSGVPELPQGWKLMGKGHVR